MSRDFKKESEWRKNKYKRLIVDLDKNIAEEFLNKINKPFSTWVKEKINEELKK